MIRSGVQESPRTLDRAPMMDVSPMWWSAWMCEIQMHERERRISSVSDFPKRLYNCPRDDSPQSINIEASLFCSKIPVTFLYFDGTDAPVPRKVTLTSSPSEDVTIRGIDGHGFGLLNDLIDSTISEIPGFDSCNSLMLSSGDMGSLHSSSLNPVFATGRKQYLIIFLPGRQLHGNGLLNDSSIQ